MEQKQNEKLPEEKILDTIHAVLVEGDFLTYDRIMSRFAPFTSCEAVLFAHARKMVEAAKEKGDLFAAWDFCKRFEDLKKITAIH